MYRCGVCRGVSAPREPMRRHVVFRFLPFTRFRRTSEGYPIVDDGTRTEVEREIPVCRGCEVQLRKERLEDLQAAYSQDAGGVLPYRPTTNHVLQERR
jgi:hypothetical protein